MLQLSPYALGTLDELLRHLALDGNAKEGDRDRGVMAGGAAVDWLERHTARALKVRTHRNTQDASATWTAATSGDQALTITSAASYVKVHDDLVGVGLEVQTRVTAVSGSTVTVDRLATANGTGVTVTAGSRPLIVDGAGGADFYVPETPLHAVYGVQYRDSAGDLVDIDITGAYIAERETGLYRLVADAVPEGAFNVEVQCLAGFKPPSATERGDREWGALNRLWLRIAEIFYQEKTRHAGRVTNQTLGPSQFSYQDERMPRDVYADAAPFVRRP